VQVQPCRVPGAAGSGAAPGSSASRLALPPGAPQVLGGTKRPWLTGIATGIGLASETADGS